MKKRQLKKLFGKPILLRVKPGDKIVLEYDTETMFCLNPEQREEIRKAMKNAFLKNDVIFLPRGDFSLSVIREEDWLMNGQEVSELIKKNPEVEKMFEDYSKRVASYGELKL